MNNHLSVPQNQWTFGRVMLATFSLVLVVFGFWLFYRFYQVIFILFIAIVVGTVIRPAVTWMNGRGLPKVAGVILVFFVLLSLLIGFVLLLVPLIIDQGATIMTAVPGYYESLQAFMVQSPNALIIQLREFMPVTLPEFTPVQQTGQQLLDFAGQAMGYVGITAKVIFIGTALLLLIYFWVLDGPHYIQSLLNLVPKIHRDDISNLITAMTNKLVFFIAGQGVLCAAIGSLAFILYMLIGLPNALVLGFIAGVMEAVPMVGPFLGAIPAGVIALSIAPVKLLWVVVGTLVIQQLESVFLVPRIMRKAVGVNPFVTLLAIFAFGSFFGIAGTLMAIPMAAIIQLLLDRYVFHPGLPEADISTGRGLASRLRYEAQDLVQDLRRQARIKKRGSPQKIRQIDQVMDEIETITSDLDALLSQVHAPGES